MCSLRKSGQPCKVLLLAALEASTASPAGKIGEDVDDVQVSADRLAGAFTQDGKGREQAGKDQRDADQFGQ